MIFCNRRTLIQFGLALVLSAWVTPACFAEDAPTSPVRQRRNVEIQWDAVEDATIYEVQVIRKEDKNPKPMRFKVKDPQWSATIKPGTYSMQIRSYDDRGVPGDWSPPSDLAVRLPSVEQVSPGTNGMVKATDEDNQSVALKWAPVQGAEKYRVVVQSLDSSWQEQKDVSGSSWDVKTPVGERFTWNVTAIDSRGELGEANAAPAPFLVKGPPIAKPKVDKPLTKYVSEVKWEEAKKAKSYTYELTRWNKEKRKWEKIETKTGYQETNLKWDISRPSGKYRIKVTAEGEQRDPSPPTVMTFETRGGFRDPAALERESLRDSLNKPTHFYAIGSYLISDIQYQAANHDTNSIPTFKALGGTGRIGAGYQNAESQWGGFGIVDYSGFQIGGQTFHFASVEGHLTHKVELGQAGLLLAGVGLYYKELPIVTGSTTESFSGIGKVTNVGPHAGFIYSLPFNERFGLQANARIYYSLLGSATNGEKAESAMSYQYGLLGSYRINTAWIGYAGYAFRHDEGLYQSSPNAYGGGGQSNSVTIDGSYLNLIMEFSF